MMDFIWQYPQKDVVQLWTSVLLHFLWQGCVIAAITSFLLRLTPNEHANRRYVATLVGLALVVIFPLATWFALQQGEVPLNSANATTGMLTGALPFRTLKSDFESPIVAGRVEAATHLAETSGQSEGNGLVPKPAEFRSLWPHIRAGVFAVWCVGQVLFSFRLICGGLVLWRLRRLATDVSSEVSQLASRMAHRMGLRSVPQVFSSYGVSDASACGFFRNVVLLPAAWLTEMPAEMLEAVLAHEFAHIRRHDTWVNLCQRFVESVFFYHPAIWWLSRQITQEREHCCDAEAVAALGCRTTFARTLEEAARKRTDLSPYLATSLGGNQMSLLNRINRVLDRSAPQRMYRWQAGIAALCVPVVLLATTNTPESLAQNQAISAPGTELGADPASPITTTTYAQDTQFAPRVANSPPTELAKVTLPDYVIEPPDILWIEGIKLSPKEPVELGTNDVIQVVAVGVRPGAPIAGQYRIEDGQIELGPEYGVIKLHGLTTAEAEAKITDRLSKEVVGSRVTVSLVRKAGKQLITGEHLVGPDGTVNLGIYGRVYLAGKTIAEAKAAIELHLAKFFEKPRVSLDISVYNSKFCYIVNESGDHGDQVARILVTGNETVLDAIAQIGGIQVAATSIWLSRPSRNDQSKDQILRVDFDAITRGASTSTNYQLLPGDRLVISDRIPEDFKPLDSESEAKLFNQLLREGKTHSAIELAKRLAVAQPDSEVAKTLVNHALLLEEYVAAGVESDLQDAADLIQEIRETRIEERKIRKALRTKIKVDFDEVPLTEVVDGMSKQLGINMLLDADGLAAEGVTTNTPITLGLRTEVSAANLLNLILEPLRLKYFMNNGVLKITSLEKPSRVQFRIYTIEDLMGLPNPSEEGDHEFDAKAMASLITSTIAPNHWDKVGGPGTVQVHGKRLVISCSKAVHAEISELLTQLREVAKRSSATGGLQRFPEEFRRIDFR